MTASRRASASSCTARSMDSDGRPVGRTLIEAWQTNAAGRYAHELDDHPAPARSELHRPGPVPHRRRRVIPLRVDQARRLSVAEPPQRLAAGAHPLLAVRAGVRAATGDADVLPGRSAAAVRPDLQLGAGRSSDGNAWSRSSIWRTPSPSGRWRIGSTSSCAAERRRRSRPSRTTERDALAYAGRDRRRRPGRPVPVAPAASGRNRVDRRREPDP